jgi:hypothetical protein
MVVTSLLLLFAQTNCNLLGGLAGSTPGTYRPPHSSQSASVKAQLFGEDETSKGNTGATGGLSKSALKNKKKRENKKEKDQQESKAVGDANVTSLVSAEHL